jgi:hypothetical protein
MRDRDILDKIAESVGSSFKSSKFDHSFLNHYNRLDDTILSDKELEKRNLRHSLKEAIEDFGDIFESTKIAQNVEPLCDELHELPNARVVVKTPNKEAEWVIIKEGDYIYIYDRRSQRPEEASELESLGVLCNILKELVAESATDEDADITVIEGPDAVDQLSQDFRDMYD